MAKRIVSLDVLRGIAIFAMTVFHLLETVVNTGESGDINVDKIANDPTLFYLNLSFPLPYWRPFFLLISASVTIYTMQKGMEKGSSRKGILQKNIFFGIVLYFLGLLRESIFSHYGLLGHWFEGDFNWYYTRTVFAFDTLQMIGFSTIITAIIHYYLTSNGNLKNKDRHIRVYAILTILVVSMTPFLYDLFDQLHGGDYLAIQSVATNFNEVIIRLIEAALVGMPEPLFPFLATTFIGNIFGLYLTKEKPPLDLPKKGAFVGLGFIIFGLIYYELGDFEQTFLFMRHPVWFYFYNTGGQIITYCLAIWIGEFKTTTNRDRWFNNSTFVRRWGMISLTIYFFEIIITFIFRILMQILFGWLGLDFIHRNQVPIGWSLVYLAIGLFFFDYLVKLWERKLHFKYSMEWFLLKLGEIVTGRKVNEDDPLDVQGILYDFELVNFVRTKFELAGKSPYYEKFKKKEMDKVLQQNPIQEIEETE